MSQPASTIPTPARLRVEMAIHNRRPTEIANAVGIAPATLSRILAGKQHPSADLLRRLESAIRGDAS